ncbi:hypothetical protein PENANT_c011G04281 [Penicillium antarcticum]|uniref:Uncharacterized protein n=1 Tax=Penicillium antarcticum TaxID=416450 RepID=A0A1V6Q807_9EURO|nr:hypothetical protein PENANT_c011G04281 [Penicillium antarcticum]
MLGINSFYQIWNIQPFDIVLVVLPPRSMADELTYLVESARGLRFADRMTGLSESDSHGPKTSHIALLKEARTLIQSAEATTSAAQQFVSLAESKHAQRDEDIARLSCLKRKANALASIAESFSDAVERYISQALDPSGPLHCDNYFVPREEASLEGPYDPDSESEDYYVHEIMDKPS